MSILSLYKSPEGRRELSDILEAGSNDHHHELPEHFMEKDLWVTEVLGLLFEGDLFEGHSVAFKGGTALSKCFNAIDRFSEDIDLSIHWADLAGVDRADESD